MIIPYGRRVAADGNTAAAVAAALARVEVVPTYPITPQTVVIERLAELYAQRGDAIFKNMESEHAMLGYAITMSHLGARVFTATSSQGLLYACEQVHRAGRERSPLVMAVVNRSLCVPWNLETDLNDSLSQRDGGWIQFYCANHQEIFDSIPLAYRIAEKVLLPAMVCYEGFILSHSTAAINVPLQEKIDEFLPGFSPPAEWIIKPETPKTYFQLPGSTEYYVKFQHDVELAMEKAASLIDESAAELSSVLGHKVAGAMEITGNPKAKTAIVAIGTIGETAKILIEGGEDILVVRIHSFRPFPRKLLSNALAGAGKIVVVDRAVSFGAYTPLAAEVFSSVSRNRVHSFIAGIGGNNVTENTLLEIIKKSSRKSAGPVWILKEGR